MNLKLYFATGACSFVPHALLEAIGVPFEPVPVKLHKGEQRSPEYLSLNPRGQVPVLVADGTAITQILAIITFLDAQFPQQQLLPREPLARAKMMETLAWMNNTAHPTFTHVFMPEKYTVDPQAQAAIKTHAIGQYRPMLEELQALARAAAERGDAFLGGASFGPLDAYALTLLRWGGFAGIDPQGLPLLWAHVQKVAQLPAVARVIERERLQLNVYKPA